MELRTVVIWFPSAELKDNNKNLCEENDQLRGYIDRLLLGVLAHSPGVLEIPSTSSGPPQSNLTQ